MRKKFITLVAISAMLFSFAGCAKRVNTSTPPPPQTVQEKYDRTVLGGADAILEISSGLVTVDSARKSLAAGNNIDADTSAKMLTVIKTVNSKLALAKDAVDLASKTNDPTIQWQAKLLDVVSVAATLDPTLFNVKNPTSQKALADAFALLKATIIGVQASFAQPAQ